MREKVVKKLTMKAAPTGRHNPWLWIPCLCIAEGIPSAVVLFVALLMFLQFGADETTASLYSGLLFLPWIVKSYLHGKVRKAASYKKHLHVVEFAMFLCLMSLAVYISECSVRTYSLFAFLFVLSFLCAWHELLLRFYYSRMLNSRQQRVFQTTRLLASQVALIVTYGVLIIVAGFFEIFFRSYQKAWAMESSLVAGVFLLFCMFNFAILRESKSFGHPVDAASARDAGHILTRMRQKPRAWVVLSSLFLLLLPQGLMFNPRVFFLLASSEQGGLGCSVQDVGFAQGTIGVLAFSIGIGVGHYLNNHRGWARDFWLMSILLTLSPFFYMFMAAWPQTDNLLLLCCMTFCAQLCFGFGLNVCKPFVHYMSGQRYRNVINYLYVPVVAGLMVLPMTVSGWLCHLLGYQCFFTLCVLVAPVAWSVLLLCRTKEALACNRTAERPPKNP